MRELLRSISVVVVFSEGPIALFSRKTVRGLHLPPARPTRWALYYALLYFALPVVALLALADLALYLLFTDLLGRCYGIFCLFG